MHLLVEEAISQDLQISNITHLSPTGSSYDHFEMKFPEDEYCGVSILRAGDSMVEPIMKLIPGITIGKILIQRDEKTAQPIFFYQKQVQDLKDKKRVFLLDPMLATGGSASMAIEQIKKLGVPSEKITFINLVSCDEGIQRILSDHPGVHILTAAIDPVINNKKYIIPGLGDYGDRYFASTKP